MPNIFTNIPNACSIVIRNDERYKLKASYPTELERPVNGVIKGPLNPYASLQKMHDQICKTQLVITVHKIL